MSTDTNEAAPTTAATARSNSGNPIKRFLNATELDTRMLGMVAAMKGFSGRQGTELAELIVDKIQSAVDKIAFR